jgi:hypothetical protein
MSDTGNNQPQPCVNCGQPVTGKFCSSCGEKVLHPHDRTIGHFFHEFFHALTHADSKFLKSLKFLLFRPGLLTKEYIAGKRKAYTSPLSLFLIANLLYLLIPTSDALNSKYHTQIVGQPYSAFIEKTGVKKMQQRKWTEQQMEEHYDHKSDKVSKVMLILLVFLFSAPVALLYYNKRHYYADHVVFATEFMNFLILGVLWMLHWALFLFFRILWYGFHLAPQFDEFFWGMYILLALCLIQLTVSAKRVYNQRWYITLPKALALVAGLAACVIIYRYILFHVVMWLL